MKILFMKLLPLPHYFIIKIDIQKQKERKEKIGKGILFSHVNEVFMQRNMQCGEVVAIGKIAGEKFKEVKLGHILIIHHLAEGSDREKSNFIYSDEKFNYYNVTAGEFNGHRNETYGVFDGEKIIPHPDFIFIEKEEISQEVAPDKLIEQKTKKVGSLILFDNWTESREQKEAKAKQITEEIKNQSKGKSMRDDVKIALSEKQNEAGKITESLNKKEYLSNKIFASNPELKKEKVYSLNIASQLSVQFMDKEYIIVDRKFCVATA